MPSRSPAQRLSDILENIEAIRAFVAGMTYEGFRRDLRTKYAVSRAFEIISEASRRLPEEIKRRHSDTDWRGLAALGNIYRHEYDVVDTELMWKFIQRRLDPLEDVTREELQRHELDERFRQNSIDCECP
jgi:uncharacterized protein with HEPN domain